jgi:hypothetical protein
MSKYKGLLARLIGEEAVMRRMWNAAGTSDPTELIAGSKRRNRNTLIIIAAGLLVSLALCTLSLKPVSLPDMTRNPYGGETKKIEAEVTAEYDGESVKKDVSIGVLSADADAAEISRKIDDLKKRLPKLILGKNKSLGDIRYDLDLIGHDEPSGADIIWSSDNEAALSADGEVNHIEGNKGDKIGLRANIRLGEASASEDIVVVIGDTPAKYDFANDIESSITAAVDSVSGLSEGDKVALPENTDGGVKLSWSPIQSKTALFAPLLFVIFGVVFYRRRYSGISRDITLARESVERDFPDFLDKLLLLLNAGVVITSAISKIADDYRERSGALGESYFYEELCRMEDRISSSRVSLVSEFTELAIRSGRREVMRFSAILADNIDKGSALGEKLSQESVSLWDMRKKNAEKKGRLAETKLTFPMVLQLVAIILITIAPAAIEMN